MAPKGKHKKGKAVDQSTEWSEWAWDEHYGCWAASRTNPDGELEYDYRTLEEVQGSNQSVATPRQFPDTSLATSSNYYSTTSSNAEQYAVESDSAYTTAPLPSPDQPSTQTSKSNTQEPYYGNETTVDSNYAEPSQYSYEGTSAETLRPLSSSSTIDSLSTIKYSTMAMTTTSSSSTSRPPYSSSDQNQSYVEDTLQAFQGLSVGASSTPQTISMLISSPHLSFLM